MVKFDAPLSVLRGFSRNEWIEILNQAGIVNYSLKWKWAFRWQIVVDSSNERNISKEIYNGIFPCFFLGSLATLFSSILKAFINLSLVWSGKITSSM